MTLSTGPWWCAPVFAFGWITTVPAQSFSAPARAWVIAAARFMPGVCAVLTSSSFACTTRTPECFHLDSAMGGLSRNPRGSGEGEEIEKGVAHDQRPEPAVSHERIALEQPVGGMERERRDALVQVVRSPDDHADVDRRRHAEALPQGFDDVARNEQFLEHRIHDRQ